MYRRSGRKIETVLVMLVFCVFAASVLSVLALGAKAYGSIGEISRRGESEQTALSYVWFKVRNADVSGRVSVLDFEGVPALSINEDYDGVPYQTLIYYYDGAVRELFAEPDAGLKPEDGLVVAEAESLLFEQIEDKLVRVSSGGKETLITLRSSNKPGGTEAAN